MNKLLTLASSAAALIAAYAAFDTKPAPPASAPAPKVPASQDKLRADVNEALKTLTNFSRQGLPNGADIITFCMLAAVNPKTPQGMRIAATMWLAGTAWKLGFHGNTHVQTVVSIGSEIQKNLQDFPVLSTLAQAYNQHVVKSQKDIDAKNAEYDNILGGPVLSQLVKMSLE